MLASQLQTAGISAAHYHADMEPAARTASHNTWSSGAVQVTAQQSHTGLATLQAS